MKSLILSVILLFSVYSTAVNAYSLAEVQAATPTATLINVFPCTVEGETQLCHEIRLNDVLYRVVSDTADQVVIVYTPKSNKYPEGIVPVEDLITSSSI